MADSKVALLSRPAARRRRSIGTKKLLWAQRSGQQSDETIRFRVEVLETLVGELQWTLSAQWHCSAMFKVSSWDNDLAKSQPEECEIGNVLAFDERLNALEQNQEEMVAQSQASLVRSKSAEHEMIEYVEKAFAAGMSRFAAVTSEHLQALDGRIKGIEKLQQSAARTQCLEADSKPDPCTLPATAVRVVHDSGVRDQAPEMPDFIYSEPKRPPSAFFLFTKEHITKKKEAGLPTGGGQLEWQALPVERVQAYHAQASALMEQYNENVAAFRQHGRYKVTAQVQRVQSECGSQIICQGGGAKAVK